jgi:hypothetical protein
MAIPLPYRIIILPDLAGLTQIIDFAVITMEM